MGWHCTLAEVVEALAAPVNAGIAERLGQVVRGVTTDSRGVHPGDLFVALQGDRFDGHQFVEQALGQGAIAAVVSQAAFALTLGSPGHPSVDLPILPVAATLSAYQQLGTWWRSRFQHPVVAVTGSVGKTTTKELIAAVLGQYGPVLKTQANFNNEIGVPKTLLEIDPGHHQFAVIEMGMRALGEIAELTHIARPDVAVITNVGTAHIGRLGSEQAIAQAKCELLQKMPATGLAVLNHDDARLLATAKTVWSGQTLTYGLEGGDIQGQWFADGTLEVEGRRFQVPLPGRHNALNFLAALTVARGLGLSWDTIPAALTVELPQGRSRRYAIPNDIVILDETYNAGLESMLASLQLLAELPGQRRVAVLGTMKELGERSPQFHQQVGEAVQRLGLDHLLVLADPAETAALLAGAGSTPAEAFSDAATLGQRLSDWVQPGDRLLFKASRAVALDRVVAELLNHLGYVVP